MFLKFYSFSCCAGFFSYLPFHTYANCLNFKLCLWFIHIFYRIAHVFSSQWKQNKNKTKTMLWYSLCHHSGGQLSGVVQLRKVRKKTTLFKVSQRMSGNVRKFEKLREVYLKRSGKGKCFNCLPSITAVFTHCNILAVMCRKF